MLRHQIRILLSTLMFMLLLVGSASSSQFQVLVDDQPAQLLPAPVLENGTVLLPLRPIISILGGTVKWDAEDQKAAAYLPDQTLEFTLGESCCYINQDSIPLALAPILKEGNIMVPCSSLKAVLGNRFRINTVPDKGTASGNRETLFQVSTINSLLGGAYDGQIPFAELKQKGDLGLGTIDRLDGEMIELDGQFYQVRSDGVAYPVPDQLTAPFAAVTYFDPDINQTFNKGMNLEELQKELDRLITNKNMFYAIKITGDFSYVKTRSVPSQSKPYPRLSEVAKSQPTFEFHDVSGTLIGFWCPAVANGVNVPGYHLHFLTSDKKAGGHLLNLTLTRAEASLDATPEFHMILPMNDPLAQTVSGSNTNEELEKVEKGK